MEVEEINGSQAQETRVLERAKTVLVAAAEHRRRTGRPLVTLSYAQSLDGSIADRPGRPLSLSGSQSLTLTHGLRASHDAILVGIGTVLADNPRLNVRLVTGESPQPVIVDSSPALSVLRQPAAHRPRSLDRGQRRRRPRAPGGPGGHGRPGLLPARGQRPGEPRNPARATGEPGDRQSHGGGRRPDHHQFPGLPPGGPDHPDHRPLAGGRPAGGGQPGPGSLSPFAATSPINVWERTWSSWANPNGRLRACIGGPSISPDPGRWPCAARLFRPPPSARCWCRPSSRPSAPAPRGSFTGARPPRIWPGTTPSPPWPATFPFP